MQTLLFAVFVRPFLALVWALRIGWFVLTGR